MRKSVLSKFVYCMLFSKTSQPVQNHLHVVPDVWVPVLVEGEASRGVEQLQVQNPDLEKKKSDFKCRRCCDDFTEICIGILKSP
jgi:hypothetical protein